MVNLNDTFINKLNISKETWFTHNQEIKLNGVKAKLILRARPSSNTFILKYKESKVTLGNYCPDNFNVDEALFKSMKILKGELTENEYKYAPTFRKMIHEVLDFNEKVLHRKSTSKQRYRLRQYPKEVLDTPITMLSFRDANLLRQHFLKHSTPANYNIAISECSAYWNRGKKEFYRDILDGKENPFINFRLDNVPKKKIAKPVFDDIITIWKQINEFEIDNYWKLFWKLKICLGCHTTELMKMTNENLVEDELGTWFHWGVNHHKISNYKNGIEHRVYIHPKVKELITEHLRAYDVEKYWFFSRSLNFGADKHKMMNEDVPSTRWQRFKKKSNVAFPNSTFRHALYTFLYGKRLNPEVVTGHCYRGSVGRENYMNWADPTVLNQFKEAGHTYQSALIEALGEDF